MIVQVDDMQHQLDQIHWIFDFSTRLVAGDGVMLEGVFKFINHMVDDIYTYDNNRYKKYMVGELYAKNILIIPMQ